MAKQTKAVVETPVTATILEAKKKKDREYMESYSQTFLRKLKGEKPVKVYCSRAYEPYFGKVYTALYNTIPVTVPFDGQYHEYPATVAEWLQNKFIKVTESNIPKVTEDLLSE